MTEETPKHDELQLKADWNKEIEKIKTTQELKDFVEKMIAFKHDYGTIVNATAIAMKATMKVINRSPVGGLTGFQASCIGWIMIDDLFMFNKDAPKRIIDFDKLLYPQNEEKFTAISKDTWDWTQKKAQENLNEQDQQFLSPRVKAHWQSIVDGKIPFGLTLNEDDQDEAL